MNSIGQCGLVYMRANVKYANMNPSLKLKTRTHPLDLFITERSISPYTYKCFSYRILFQSFTRASHGNACPGTTVFLVLN